MSITVRTRQIVLDRDLYRCIRCGAYIGPFGDYSIHHRRPRGMGGSKRPETDLPANLLTLCGSGTTGCHGYIESHREEAYEQGLLLHQTDNPEGISVTTFRGSLFLNNDGSFDVAEDAQ